MSFDCVEFCKTLADDTRQQILEMLQGGEKCVSDIVAAFDMSQPTISHHLNILKRFGLVTSRKEGKQERKNRKIKMVKLSLWYGSLFDKSTPEKIFNGIKYHLMVDYEKKREKSCKTFRPFLVLLNC